MLKQTAFTIIASGVLILSACGGSDDAAGNNDATGNTEPAADETPVADEATAETDGGSGQGVLTVEDGTVYEFDMSSCETSNNSDTFLVDPGYDLFGRTSDGFTLYLGRAAFEEPTSALGDLGGRFDENGVNPKVNYVFREPDSVITLDGNTITGQLVLDGFISQENIHGEETTATLTITC